MAEDFRNDAMLDRQRDDGRKVGAAFADPNSLDDARLGKAFEESNSSRKKKHPAAERGGKAESHKLLYLFVAGALVLFLLLFVAGWVPRHRRNEQARRNAEATSGESPVVEVVRVRAGAAPTGLVVPGTTSALTEAYVYARANGYLMKRFVDIGDHVRKGQLLAVIDSPDLDQQVNQAREQLGQAEAQLAQQRAQQKLTRVTVERTRTLVAEGVYSRQQGDQSEAEFGVQEANVAAAGRNVEALRANLRRALGLQSYERVTAPFNGVVTQRNVDIGALISAQGAAGGAGSTAQSNTAGSSGNVSQAATSSSTAAQGGPLFGLAQVRRLRILVSVPEAYAGVVHTGGKAQLNFQELPGQNFFGAVTRSSAALDQNTRTLATEIEVDNSDGRLRPGMYAVVTFAPPAAPPPLVVSGDAVALRNDRPVVATVVDGKVHMAPVTLGRDFGTSVEVLAGLKEGDLLVTNVTDTVVEGTKVRTQMVK